MDEITDMGIGSIRQQPRMIRMVLATGVVSSESAAERVLLGIAILGFIIIGTLTVMNGGGAKPLTSSDIQRIVDLQEQSGIYAQ